MRKYFTIKKLGLLIALCIGISVFLLWYCNKQVLRKSDGKTFSSVNDIPFNKTGLLLGTGMLLGNGNVNPFFQNRIAATVQLMKVGKIENLIISGDNGRVGYDEPSDMRNQLIAAGIDSTRIYLDYAGFRTYDSMVRAKKIFGQTNLTVISQLFHNERAIYIAESFGMSVIGFNAADVGGERGEAVLMREWLARVNAWLDVLISKDPHFLGPQVTILP